MSDEAIQQSLLVEEVRIEQLECAARMRKTAFRVAFDFLEKHDPPEYTEEYWTGLAADVMEVSGANMDNALCQRLLTAVVLYLDDKQEVINSAKETCIK